MKLALVKGATSVTILIFIQDSSSTTGAGLTGLVFNSAGLTAYYARPRAAPVVITLATQTVAGAFSSGGFVQLDATNMPGWYRLDLPDAALVTGVDSVGVHLKGATNMAPLPLEIQLTAVNFNDANGGLTNLDAAVTSRMATYAQPTGFLAATFPTTVASTTNITAGTITTVTNLTNAPTAGDLTATMKASVNTEVDAAMDTAIPVTPTADSINERIKTLDDNFTVTVAGRIDAAITTRATPAQVNTEVLDVLNVDTFAEPGQEAPPATTTLVKKIGYLFKAWRNKKTQTATTRSLFADDGTTVDQKATDSDDATTFTKGELGTGP